MDAGPDSDESIAHALGTLGNPIRLRMMRLLQQPRALREIEASSPRPDAGRTISRQSVREHLDRMMEVGVVVSREARRPYGATQEFVLNHQAVFALAEEVRALARLKPAVETPVPTSPIRPERKASAEGPRLVIVHGLEEGTAFDLRPAADHGQWLIGRRRGLPVSLDFDPYVSSEHALVTWRDGRHLVQDLPESRNGTSVNFRPLAKDEQHALRHGDVVGVGRSLLVYWT